MILHVKVTIILKLFRLYVDFMYIKTSGSQLWGEILILKKGPSNERDKLAVSVHIDGQIVGHVPLH